MRIHSDARCDPAYFEFSPIKLFKWLNDHSNRDAGYMLKVSGDPSPERADYNLTLHEIRILKLLVEGLTPSGFCV